MAAPDQAASAAPMQQELSKCPLRMAADGIAVAVMLGYMTLYANKKPEASAGDVAKVIFGAGTMENTHPRK